MNMKSIYKYFITILVATTTFTACSMDDLEIEQQGVLTTDKYLTANDSEVEQFIAAIYAVVLGDSFEAVLQGEPASYRSFQYEMNRMGAETSNYYAYNESADAKTYSAIWRYYYRTIYWCNMIIEYLPGNKVASSNVKEQVLAEARTIRAISMMYLVQLYGNPPLANHILNGSEGNTPASESWAFIESELNATAEILPTKAALGGQATIGGRLTREAAYAYLGKAQLWQKKYDEAAKTLYNKVIATQKYALYDNYNDYNSSRSDFSDENIWEFDFNGDPSVVKSQEGCFDLACFSPGVSMWFDTWASLLMTWAMGANASASYVDFLIAHDGENSARYNASILECCTASTRGVLSTPIAECEGYLKIKDQCLAEDVVGEFPYFYNKRNVAYMRYAEVLLNYAEAVAEGGTQGTMSGLEALNLVRRRAGLEDAPTLSMDDTNYGVKAERRIELFAEGHRFIDLVRWGDAATELKNCGKLLYTCNLNNGVEIAPGVNMYFGKEILSSSTGGNGFQSGKHELLPIPTTDINNNPILKQNPNW